jgi:uncharacterized protein YkwD
MSVSAIVLVAAAWLFLLVLALAVLRTAGKAERAAEARLRRPPEPDRSDRSDALRRARGAVLMVAAVPLAAAALDATSSDARAQGSAACAGAAPAATLCLINVERRQRGLPPLTANARLTRAALRHSRDMVNRRYFAHVSLSGSTFIDRLRRSGYLARCRAWSAGETLAWGTGSRARPASRVAAWMRSRPHRQIILDPSFREAGIGIAAGTPTGRAGGATYTGEFARRRC